MIHKPLRILTCVWGEKHVDWFLRGTAKTLSWKSNKEAIDGATWTIATRADEALKIQNQLVEQFPNVQIDIKVIPQVINQNGMDIDTANISHSGLILMELVQEIKKCLETKSRFLLAPPDTVFSENAVKNMITIGDQEQTCVAVPHPRILPEFLDDEHFTTQSMPPDLMVKVIFNKYLHQSWKTAEIGLANQSSLVGGISWEKLASNDNELLIKVQHRLPTIYLASFQPEDLNFFINQPSFGSYDHVWPGERLIHQERQRTVGSSDAVFIAELTDFEKNNPPWTPQHTEVLKITPDAFYRDNYHHRIARLFVSIFRGR